MSMVYWADMLYASPAPEEAAQEASPLAVEGTVDADDADLRWLNDVSEEERRFVEALGYKLGLSEVTATPDELAPDPIVPESPLEAVPLPPWLKKRLMRVLLRDVHHYLYDVSFSPVRVRHFRSGPTSASGHCEPWKRVTPSPDHTFCSGTAWAPSSLMTR